MSERSPMRSNETTHHSSSGVSHNDTLDDAAGAANNSIIGKVKSRVSSILPNRLSKWFSPSTKTNDSLNGSLLLSTTVSANARRRRRIELDDDEDEDDEEDIEAAAEDDAVQYDENSLRPQHHHTNAAQDDNSDDDDDGEEDEEESNNSEEDTSATAATTTTHQSGGVHPRRALNTNERVRQPPSKRSRFNLDLTNVRGSPLVPRQPLVASTPAMGSNINMRGFTGHMSNPPSVLVPIRGQSQRYSHLNLYGGQQQGKKDPPYNFISSKRDAHLLDFTAHQINDPNATTQGNNSLTSSGMSSRRSLNIPSTMQNTNELMYTGGLSHLKRQSLATVRNSELPSTSAGIAAPLHRTSTTIPEEENDDGEDIDEHIIMEETAVQVNADTETEATKYNGRGNVATAAKRQKLINGAGGGGSVNTQTEAAVVDDSVSESSGEGVACRNELNDASRGRKTGLFNMSAANSHNGSRTSSVGNGLNFYSHLEGRKSLFAGGQGAAGAAGKASSSMAALNNSTLSLTSLNRRQFNASIYGSTSALSDSRLLNTFSPFYKGKTTYGGAAAYNKYAAAATGAGASAVRLTPTLIRPTSSLSTLSSSNNSLAAGAAGAGAGGGIAGGAENSSAISSTAKRILDLINDFATPLSEAKKMAGNLKTQQQQQLQSKSSTRLNEADLQATRALRLSQVRTPYMRPSVTLQPTTTAHLNGKSATLPPTRELQVPSMSQLLQMKKMQSTTERSRQITTQNTFATATSTTTTNAQRATVANSSNEYTLPNAAAQAANNRSGGDWQQSPHQQLASSSQQKYTNKIKNKVSSSARITGSKDAAALADANAPPPAVNLPNIAFPLMQSIPKIDIKLPNSSGSSPLTSVKTDFKFTTAAPNSSGAVNTNSFSAFNASNVSKNITTTKTFNTFNNATPPKAAAGTVAINFKFSAPLELKRALNPATPTQQTTPICSSNYKFSPPTLLMPQNASADISSAANSNTTPIKSKPLLPAVPVPQLKTGSVLDALKKPFKPVAAVATGATTFGDQFKKAASEWECDACMLRNKQDANKCVACETPRKSAAAATNVVGNSNNLFTSAATTGGVANSFGSQFKKSTSEWECDACMLRNKQDAVKCVACETPHKTAASSAAPATATTAPLQPIKNTFGDAFKPKSNTWECDTCLVNNKADCVECIACQTRRPGAPAATPAAATTTSFKFGFANAAAGATKAAAADAVFQTLAAEQKAAKWECEACMTRNDAARVKCVCCEQAKPGTQTVSESVPKFAFGTSAAAKFNFGFGASNTTKETELRQAATTAPNSSASQKTDAPAPAGFTFGSKAMTTSPTDAAKRASGGFTFGIKPAATASTQPDATKAAALDKKEPASLAGFKFGTTPDAATSTAPTSASTGGFTFGAAKNAETTVAAASGAATKNNSTTPPSVKFNLPTQTIKPIATTTTNAVASNEVAKTTTAAAAPTATFSFGSPAASTTSKPAASGGFSFGSAASPLQNSKKDSSTPLGAASAAAGGFAFKTPAVTAAAAVSTTTTATSAAAFGSTPATAVAANKPMFSFGASASTTTSASVATVSSAATTVAGGFSFGSNSSNAAAAATKAAPPAFNSTSSTATTTANVFGATTSSSALPVFGATAKVSDAPAPAPAASSTSTFGSFGSGGAAASNTNVFGSFGGAQNSPASKQTATATPFGNPSSTAPAAAAAATPFLFGSSSATTAATSTNANSAASGSTSTWPKNSFVFGGAAAATAAPNSTADSGTAAKTSNVFGSFGAPPSAAGATAPSLFGASAAPATAAPQSVFGSAASSTSTTGGLFGSNSMASAGAAASSTNLFGSTGPSGNATTPAPAFGTSPFGGGSTASVTPTFGSAAAAPTTFGGFGSAASAAASSVTDGASAAKKSDPSVFSFGAAPATKAVAQATSGGFNFGAPTAKPAFNFAPTNQPAFNFTGTVEQTQTMTTTMTTATPFQFGATPAAPVYNFSGGAVETTPYAPFQFNAGATPASSNIFAPQPTPGAAQSAQQQARRKIRAPIRRQTPR